VCSGHLTINNRSFACVHPRANTPLDLTAAIAYSCNEYVVKMAQRFTPTEQLNVLRRYGLASRTNLSSPEASGEIRAASSRNIALQTLGEQDIEVTVLGLATAYRRLATSAPQPVREGMEGAVEYGTAQGARIAGVKIAGKTGSSGNGRWAWFAGFAPSVKPRFVVAVRTQGSSGGADAAPIAAELLTAAFRNHA
jgi:cell division protein FtsI/penicillin-binding protein 2